MPKIIPSLLLFCVVAIGSSAALAGTRASISAHDAKLSFADGELTLTRRGEKIVQLTAVLFNYTRVDNWTVQTSDERGFTLTAKLPADVDFFRAVTDTEARSLEMTVRATDGGFHLHAAPEWGRQVTLEFEYLDDHFFGLSEPLQPDNRLSPDLTGTSIVVDAYAEDAAFRENYASAFSAFYMSSHGYGSFFDSFAQGRYEFAVNGKNRIHHNTGTLDWHILLGDTGVAIHRAYFDLIGEPKNVPVWFLGAMGWRDQNNGGAQEVLEDIAKLTDIQIPFTSWLVDRPYSDGAHGWSKMNFSDAFANPGRWIGEIRDRYHMEFLTWASPAFFGDQRFNRHLPGSFSYIDLSDPQTVAAYKKDLAKQYAVGVKGHKIDRADEGFPNFEQWVDSTPVSERRNKYAYLMAKVHDEALREAWGSDQVTFARTAIHRTQPFLSAIWGGDPRTSWAGLQSNMANAMRAGYMGFPVWGTNVGGYQGDGLIPEDLFLRWLQVGSMAGLFEVKLDGAHGSGKDRMPWRYGREFQKRFSAIAAERMRFLPYLHSLANTSAESGVMMQPMAYRHLNDPHTYSIWDQFYLGDALLVAPILDERNVREVYLPEGEWRDFNDLSRVRKGGRTYTVEADIDTLPRFIKANSLYVTGHIYRANDQLWQGRNGGLTLHAYPAQKSGEVSFTYVDLLDGDRAKAIRMQRSRKMLTLELPAIEALRAVEILLDKAPREVLLNGNAHAFAYDEQRQAVTVGLAGGAPARLVIAL